MAGLPVTLRQLKMAEKPSVEGSDGNPETQSLLAQNLRREMAEQSKAEISEALCYTQEYIREYILSFGNTTNAPTHVLPTAERRRLRDKSWWTKDEKENMKFACPAPWD